MDHDFREPATPVGGRREPRRMVTITNARFRTPGATSDSVTVDDLSTKGFRVRWQYRVEPGTRVWITLPKLGILPAIVRWNREFELGCQFESPLHPSVFAHLLAAVGERP
jgi:hypothetical protein